MNKLKLLIKKMIHDEVNRQLNELLINILKSIVNEKEKNNILYKENISHLGLNKNHIKLKEQKKNKINIKGNQHLSNVLSEIVNDYVPNPHANDDIIQEMQSENDMLSNNNSNLGFIKEMTTNIPNTNKNAVNINEHINISDNNKNIPSSLKKVFNRDYRELMKKIDEKKKNGLSGNFNIENIV